MGDVNYIRVLLAFCFVIALIYTLSWLLRRIDSSKLVGNVQRKRRLQMVEQQHIDPKRKLVIIRCDEKEHLLLLNAQGAVVIERDLEGVTPDPEGVEKQTETVTETAATSIKTAGTSSQNKKARA